MKKLLIITGALIVILIIAFKGFQKITLDENLGDLIENGAIIIDVRSYDQFEASHLEGAINIPLTNMKKDSINLESDQIYITTCQRGILSYQGSQFLKSQGYSNVYNGGAWKGLKAYMTK